MEASEDGSELTGKVLGDIVDGQRKKELLQNIARQEDISLNQVSFSKLSGLMLGYCCWRRGK